MKTKDFNAQFEKMKEFKQKYPEATDNDEFFKALYSRLRKYVKKLNKQQELEDKIQKGAKLTADQKDMLDKKKQLLTQLEEMVSLNQDYMNNFDNHCEQIYNFKNSQVKSQGKEEDSKVEAAPEPTKQPEPEQPQHKEPEVDVEAIRKEGYEQGFQKGKDSGYSQGKKEAYGQGKSDGYAQARDEFDAQVPEPASNNSDEVANYTSMVTIMSCWVDNLMLMNPRFNRNDYFTEEECYAIKQLYYLNSMMPQPLINFKRMVDGCTYRTMKLANKVDEVVPNCQNVTYKSLAETFDRVLENDQFNNTNHQLMTGHPDFSGGFGGFGSMPGQMPFNMSGQMPGQMQGQMPAFNINPLGSDMPINLQNKVAGNIDVFGDSSKQNEAQHESAGKVHQDEENTPAYQSVEITSVVIDAPAQSSATAHDRDLEQATHQPVGATNDPWNEDYDDEEDDDPEENESDGKSGEEDAPDANKETFGNDLEQPQEPGEDMEKKGGQQYDNRPYKPRGGRGYNRGYNNSRGYNRGYNNTSEYRGGYRGNNEYRGSGEARGTTEWRGDSEHRGGYRGGQRGGRPYKQWDNQGTSRGQRRGGRYRDDRGGRGGHWQQPYHEEDKQEHEAEEKFDDDGFNVVNEKVFVQKKRGRGGRGKPRGS